MNKPALPRSIYKTKGPAAEYGLLGCNLYGDTDGKVGGCQHGCTYCYCPQVLHISRERFVCVPKPKPRILESLERAADKMVALADTRRVAFGFIGDAYCPGEMDYGVTRQALQIMVDRKLNFEIITKGGLRACRDFDLLKQGGRLGVSLVWASEFNREAWEPGAACIASRVESLMFAHTAGIYTWLSVEPVERTNEALAAVRQTLPWVDEFRFGIERNAPYYHEDYWPDFVREAHRMVTAEGKAFLFKDSLRPYLPQDWPPELRGE